MKGSFCDIRVIARPVEVATTHGIENVPDKPVAETHETEVVDLIDDQNEDVELP